MTTAVAYKSAASDVGYSGPRTDEIRQRLSMVRLLEHDNVDLRRQGPQLVGLCPFHQEKSPSFTVWQDHAHCFGCGWHGDIFSYWMERTGFEFKAAKEALAGLAGLSAAGTAASTPLKKKVTPLPHQSSKPKEKPALPVMRTLSGAEIESLAALRGLSVISCRLLAERRRIGFCVWPQWERQRDVASSWQTADQCFPCWVITDSSRNVAQFRRLDGGKFTLHDREIKAWTKGSPTWPVGAEDLRQSGKWKVESRKILLVEGGPDFLAAYHFLLADWRLKNGRPLRVPEIAVVAMLGASCAIAEDALALFEGKRVRIVIHNDEPKQCGLVDDKPFYRVPSFEAAARWTEQLTAAGAVVETFSLAGIPLLTEGNKENKGSEQSGNSETSLSFVKDLNDLALCAPEVWQAPEIRAAFFDWDF